MLMEEYVEHNDNIVKEILINEFFVLVISSPKLYRISGMTHLTKHHRSPNLFFVCMKTACPLT